MYLLLEKQHLKPTSLTILVKDGVKGVQECRLCSVSFLFFSFRFYLFIYLFI